MPTQMDIRQSVLRAALNMAGTAVNATVDTILPVFDAELGKLFEDRNIFLTDGGTVTFTGTQVQFTEAVNLVLNQKISGAVPQVISLGSASQNFVSSGDMWIAVINRTAGTAVTSIVTAGNALPAVSNANQEVFLIAKRIDAADGTQRLYFRNGSAFNAGQSARLGSAGSGSGSGGSGDDLDSLQFSVDFSDLFTENSANANSSIVTSGTNATFSAAKSMYVVSYDASKTVSTAGTTATMSAAPTFTVAVGDQLVSGGVAKKITAVASQTSYTLESAFASNLAAAAATVSQAVYTKDINNFVVDGSALSSAFPAAFSEIMVDYKDNAITNSNVFTPGTPNIAWTGSPDNTNFTTVNLRSASELISQTSVILPSAGTSLYLRFFANQTSGSGTVNLITYKAYWQKSVTAAGTSNVLWSTFAMTNNSTTPINSTVSVVGGKTTITVMNNTYPQGLLSGQTIGALEVLLNGASIDRFVAGSTPTTDAYYTEVSPNVIQLDRDYSSQALSISLIYSLQVIDNSSVNTSSISAIQNELSDSTQAYISQSQVMSATTTIGTPAAGTFYSAIVGRSVMVDLTQDLKPRFGIERMPTQQVFQMTSEFGPNGEIVYGLLNDTFNQVRFVGTGWISQNDSNGPRVENPSATTNGTYFEVVFYGTGLNLLFGTGVGGGDLRASVDGGAEGSNLLPLTISTINNGLNYNQNIIVPIVSGLTPGIHTVKVRANATGFGFEVCGLEFINIAATATNVSTSPGISYGGGTKSVTSARSTLAYNSVVTGTKGGRVLQYQQANGTIAQAFTPVNATAAIVSSVDHTNEEVARAYQYREFGAGSATDFSTIYGSSSRYFTMDDNVTTMVASNVAGGQILNGTEGLSFAATGQTIQITFVGTGLDIQTNTDSAYSANITAYIDNGIASSLTIPAGTISNVKVASGLPYGTHMCVITIVSSAAGHFNFQGFKVYQPKKPSLPSGATELADFNVMANYTANTVQSFAALGQGVLRKVINREMQYIGTSWTSGATITGGATTQPVAGNRVLASTTGSQVRLTFFGTGFDWRWSTNSATTYTIAIDGLAPTAAGATATGFYGQISSFVASTGVVTSNGTGSFANGTWVSGLPLGLHTLTITWNAAVSTGHESIDIITPVYSPRNNLFGDVQDTLAIGNSAISDNRKLTLIKDSLPATKAYAVAYGITSAPSTTASSSSPSPIPDMNCTVKTSGGALEIEFFGDFTNSTGGAGNAFYLNIDGQQIPNTGDLVLSNGQAYRKVIIPASAGVHNVFATWGVFSGTLSGIGTMRTLIVKER